jgi:hypothetical protein
MRKGLAAWTVLLGLAACSRLTETPDEKDWRRMLPKVTGFEGKHAGYVRMHLLEFPDCRHRPSAEDFYLTRCTQHHEACKEYFELFPAGERRSELEPVLWQACAAQGDPTLGPTACYDCCALYRDHLPTGSHRAEVATLLARAEESAKVSLAAAKASLAAAKAAMERQEDLDRRRQNAVWGGPLVELALDVHPGARLSDLTFGVAGRAAPPTASYPPTITVPAGIPVDVCFTGGPAHFSALSHDDCVAVEPEGDRLRVPLTRVFVSYPKTMDHWCGLEVGESQKDELWLMPGPHDVSCQFNRDFAGRLYQSTEGELKVRFNAPARGGTVHVVFSVVRNQIHGEAIVSERWEGRVFPLEVRGD